VTISGRRALVVRLLGELLYVERRLADEVLQAVASSVSDGELKAALEAHRLETVAHRERVEEAFRRLEISPTSNRVPQFEHLVEHHEELAGDASPGALQDLVHAGSALEVEQWEIARYETLLTLLPPEAAEQLRISLDSERSSADALVGAIERIARSLEPSS
jgi:ferritin-like metal-binding protein YciE